MQNDIRMQNMAMPTQLSPADSKTGLEEDFSENRNEFVEELKHSIRTHIILMNGVSDQLCAYLLKLIDFMTDQNIERRSREIAAMSYSIAEAGPLFVSGSIDSYYEKYQNEGKAFPDDVKQNSDAVLVQIGINRSSKDKIAAKNAVLKAAAVALNSFGSFTGTQYPQLVDVNGVPL